LSWELAIYACHSTKEGAVQCTNLAYSVDDRIGAFTIVWFEESSLIGLGEAIDTLWIVGLEGVGTRALDYINEIPWIEQNLFIEKIFLLANLDGIHDRGGESHSPPRHWQTQ
jgi:hypothetical protein